MSGQTKRPATRGVLAIGEQVAERAAGTIGFWRRARDFVAKGLLKKGNRIWAEHPAQILQAIDKIEQAWALTHDPKIAIQLATMYDMANRNQDALVVLQQAFA